MSLGSGEIFYEGGRTLCSDFRRQSKVHCLCALLPVGTKTRSVSAGFGRTSAGNSSSLAYGKLFTGHIDPIEKKPVTHYRPGTRIFSVATSGCNWLCRYCQNYDISQRRKVEGMDIEPADVPRLALSQECQGIAYTYNEPTIFIEYARDIGIAAHKKGLFNIFVSNGFATPRSVEMMAGVSGLHHGGFQGKRGTRFVRKYIGVPGPQPIFDSLKEIKEKTKIHVEITDLVVPQVGDDLDACAEIVSLGLR